MNDNAKKWVAALRDPNNKQCRCKLKKGDANCALGLACKIFKEELDLDEGPDSYEGMIASLPFKVMDHLGLRSDIGRMNNHTDIPYYNDNGLTFPAIADIIESEPAGLFV